ncbi:Hypothetical predicted protein [Olea europaea subsp. europaea]|uniref:Uncharacterized protein n=1 Tax=Olea europaea subsp. europaea TaxID=158383 RepID=A0A8S0UZJ4_OLEEU|nr:Hypothetical predicted protein [Olea europaea subsp. europaea]
MSNISWENVSESVVHHAEHGKPSGAAPILLCQRRGHGGNAEHGNGNGKIGENDEGFRPKVRAQLSCRRQRGNGMGMKLTKWTEREWNENGKIGGKRDVVFPLFPALWVFHFGQHLFYFLELPAQLLSIHLRFFKFSVKLLSKPIC